MRRALLRSACGLGVAAWASLAWAGAAVQGIALDDTVTVGGVALQMNGAGWRKRGYFKVDVTALYTAARVSSLDALEKAPGPKRIELVMLQDISGAQASRFFLIDFEASATPAEFGQLINEVSEVGAIYSGLPQIRKGDVITLDWIPAKGLVASMNGTVLQSHGGPMKPIDNELLGRIMLRMYVGGKTPAELHDNLLGASTSMRDR